MLQIGTYHTLEILRLTPPGLFLGDGDKENEVLLPNKYIPTDYNIGDKIKVFVYQDFDERVVATTLTPKILLNEVAVLDVVDNSRIGSFMDWGLEKDLLVPFSEQNSKMRVGGRYLIYMYFDEETGRLVGTQKYRRFLNNESFDLHEGDEVDLI
ncbi:MAG: GntR family transcriptional regulator, partial [Bacteroidia bacterium]|nr:GntR family transcriptional regulator [Bacteroidia bacterium]